MAPRICDAGARSDSSCILGVGNSPHPPACSLTAPPKAGLQPVLPGPHAPHVQAVLLAESFRERQVREDVRYIVAGKSQVDLSAGLWDTHTTIRLMEHGTSFSTLTPTSARPPVSPYLVVPGLGIGT